MRWGKVIKENDCLQMLQMKITSSFLMANATAHTNHVVRQNVSPKLLQDYHSPCTAVEGIGQILSSFFISQKQKKVCTTYHNPLMVKTDCALVLQTAILKSLAFDKSNICKRAAD